MPDHLRAAAEAAFRDALTASLCGLALADHNLLRLHYFHRLGVDQLAGMFASPPAAIARQLTRIRARVLREVRRGLAARLALDRRELDHLTEVARHRLDLALARVLRA